MKYNKTLAACFVLFALCCVGCRSLDVVDSAQTSSAVVAVSPVAASYGVAYGADVSTQSSSIAIGAPNEWYSQQVTKSELWQKAMRHGYKFHEPWKYMGTKDGEHYLALYPFLGFREIYRITDDEYPIEEPFDLTSRSSKWREIIVFSHHGVEYPFVIEPFLLEQPDGLEFFGGNVIELNGVGGDVEDLFMQDVQILGE